jgi:uncharacterized protein (DUF302 family)
VNRLIVSTLLAFVLLRPGGAAAEETLMARVGRDFDTALEQLQQVIAEYGYTVSHVQRCDVGLQGSGYQTDKYRVVFFGKLDEVRAISSSHPELVPFLPLNIAVFAENGDTILSVFNPAVYEDLFPDNGLSVQFRRWESDVRSILDEMRARTGS